VSRSGRLAHAIRLGVACCVLGAATLARGQAVGYQLNRWEPSPAGDPFLTVEYPWYSQTRWFAGGLSLDYAHGLLAAQHRDGAGNLVADPAPIAHQLSGRINVAGSLFDRVALTFSAPFVLYDAGTPFGGIGPSGAVAGDPRIGLRVRAYGQPDSLVSLGFSAYVWAPVGSAPKLAGDDGVRVMPRVTLGGLALGHLRWAFNASYLYRPTARLSAVLPPEGNTIGAEVQLGLGLSYVGLDRRLSVGPEATIGFAVAPGLPASQRVATVELLAGLHYLLLDRVLIGAGVGTALAGAPGPPDARALFSIAYAPLRERRPRLERVVILPDEDGHVGGVVVDDGKRRTVLDRPYASTELARTDHAPRAVQATANALPADLTQLARAMPPPDRDGDGILDADDACPERQGLASTDPLRAGCPPTAEKVVLLPGADGHTGAVEVGEGDHRTLLDAPYASAEIDAQGAVRAVPPAPSKTIARAIAAVALALPPADADEDGVLDDVDACPSRAGLPSSDPLRSGCPPAAERVVLLPDADGHVGGVEADDGKTKRLLDQAYASVEVGRDGVAQAFPPAPAKAVAQATAALASSLPVADTDGDGVRDELDACPARPGTKSSDPLRHGCPAMSERVVLLPGSDGHVGAIEVDDGTAKVLLAAAYASAEHDGGRARLVEPSGEAALERALAALGLALPIPDRDDDGIPDEADACPDRAGPGSPSAPRHGCPRAVERVVVLADETGHVGAVEVDTGGDKVLLDGAYASAEVGADRRTLKLTAEPSEVSERYAKALAAQPPGARIILYFTARSEPARDLTGPIDNLVAELKGREAYQVEVIGHTDQTGSEGANRRIGLARARLIGEKLIAAGAPRDRVLVSSKGSSEPVVKLRNRRAVELRNRRVEIWVR